MGIEQGALGIATKKGVVGVLAVDIRQPVRDLAHLPERHRGAVQPCTRAAAGIHHPAQQHAIVFGRDFVGGEPVRQATRVGKIEFGDDLGTFAAGANHAGLASGTHGETQGVQEDGFAGAGFAGKRAKSATELEFETVHDHEITDLKTTQHGWRALRMGAAKSSSEAFRAACRNNCTPRDAGA